MTNKKCKLPPGSTRTQQKGYEEVHVPALKAQPPRDSEQPVMIDDLPEWAQPAFKGFKKLNRVQSRLFPVAFGTDENVLLCAPTGAGKTNVALLTMLHEIGAHRNPETNAIDFQSFKVRIFGGMLIFFNKNEFLSQFLLFLSYPPSPSAFSLAGTDYLYCAHEVAGGGDDRQLPQAP